jgi:hypothetical protein
MATPSAVELNVSSIYPKHPERICWGCEKLCPAKHLMCRETRAAHPVELFGDDWWEASNAQPTCDVTLAPEAKTIQIPPYSSGE